MVKRKYTNEDLLNALREHPELSFLEWQRQKIKPSAATIRDRFGGWNKARKKAGVKILSKRDTKEERVQKLKEILETRGAIMRSDLKEAIGSSTISGLLREVIIDGMELNKTKLTELCPTARGTKVFHFSDFFERAVEANRVIYWVDAEAVADLVYDLLKFEPDFREQRTRVFYHKLKKAFPDEVCKKFNEKTGWRGA